MGEKRHFKVSQAFLQFNFFAVSVAWRKTHHNWPPWGYGIPDINVVLLPVYFRRNGGILILTVLSRF
jgi:hypothetical protein